MRGNRRDVHQGSEEVRRLGADARRTRERLSTLSRRSGLRERGQETGDNTPWANAAEEIQDALTKPIPAGRLKGLPEAIHCLPCAERLERQRQERSPPIRWTAKPQLPRE
jgi:hypothetical protein